MRTTPLIFVALLSACGSSPGGGQQVDPGNGTAIGIGTDEHGVETPIYGSANANGIETPKNLPAWSKIYPGGKVIAAMTDTSAHPGGSVSYVTADPVAKVAAFYDAALNAAGKKPGPTADTPEAAVRFVRQGCPGQRRHDNDRAGEEPKLGNHPVRALIQRVLAY